jgi:MinD superfamily P-loop ATPase
VDCDVDAPNLALMFNLQKAKIDSKAVQTTEKSFFKEDNCVSCKACVDDNFCIFGAIRWDEDNEKPILDPLACEGCGACSVLCEYDAYGIKPIESGYIYYTKTEEGFPLVYGETIIGASTSGKTVSETKEFANKYGEGAELMLIDGPPGIGCPVLATLTDVDFAIVVVEPFAAAFHDASRIIEVIQGFKKPFGIIVNRADAWKEGYDMLTDFMSENGFTHLGDIPIDMDIPKSVVHMQSIVKFAPDGTATNALKEIVGRLTSTIDAMEDK